jgi:CRISPR-associated protein Cmr3
VRGPLLVELDSTTGDIAQWLVPAPADALLLDAEPPDPAKVAIKRLVPLQLPPRASTNLPGDLSLVGMPKPDPRKPCGKAPRHWKWDLFERWLLNPQDKEVTLAELGHNGPVPEERMHVSIQPVTQTAAEGALFQTRGLEFTRTREKKLTEAIRLGLAVATNARNLRKGIAPLGGERRLVSWRRSSQSLPSCPPALREKLIEHGHCRVVLLTPAHFQSGSQPSWLVSSREGVTPSLKAIAISRPQVVSGWNFEINKPKPTRRLAPAGTVLFLRLNGDDTAIEKWIEATWMCCVSDEEQDRRDGFGLAVLGVWDGSLRPMEV